MKRWSRNDVRRFILLFGSYKPVQSTCLLLACHLDFMHLDTQRIHASSNIFGSQLLWLQALLFCNFYYDYFIPDNGLNVKEGLVKVVFSLGFSKFAADVSASLWCVLTPGKRGCSQHEFCLMIVCVETGLMRLSPLPVFLSQTSALFHWIYIKCFEERGQTSLNDCPDGPTAKHGAIVMR